MHNPQELAVRCHICSGSLDNLYDYRCALCRRETCDKDIQMCQDEDCDLIMCFACVGPHMRTCHPEAWD